MADLNSVGLPQHPVEGVPSDEDSDMGSNGSLPSSMDEAPGGDEQSDDNSGSEKNFDEDGLNSSVAKGLYSPLFKFVSLNNIPLSMIFDDEFYGDFMKLAYLTTVHNVDVAHLRKYIAFLFCKQAFPPKMVEDEFFTEFLKVKISEADLKSDCLDIFKQEKSRIMDILGNIDGRVPEKAVKKSLSGWGFEGKVLTITTGCDMISREMYDYAKETISGKGILQINGPQPRVSCCADLLFSLVQEAFEKIQSEIGDIQLISFWPKSPPLWYLTLEHLKQALQSESEGEFEKDMYKDYDIPSPLEWSKVRGVCKLVDTIYNVAKTLFDTKLSTAPMFFHGLLELQSKLKEDTESADKFVSILAVEMLDKVKEYWADMSLVLSIATVMDPRCKMKFVEFSLSKFNPGDQNSEIANVQEALHSLYNEYAAKTVSTIEYPPSDLSGSEEDEEEENLEMLQVQNKKKREIPADAFKWVTEYEEFTKVDNQPLKSELVSYLEESVLPWSNNFSALAWWRGAKHQYPILSKIAQEYLAIPLSLVTSYEAYTTGERHTDDHVRQLDRETRNPLMCTQSWLRKQH